MISIVSIVNITCVCVCVCGASLHPSGKMIGFWTDDGESFASPAQPLKRETFPREPETK